MVQEFVDESFERILGVGVGGMGNVRGSRNRKAGVPTTFPESRNESDFFPHAGEQVTGTGGPEVPRASL